ncbi:uncharacterized protein LOC113359282 [Papaver somniferum]|uniref:uncharacterized protein LOC113359282 n=1 Tax=Papaver somniferum TaxID=3469 RepID=UPI000E6FE95F|nr:uncharacterized protein LOC113359282 [Papaver somniferum]
MVDGYNSADLRGTLWNKLTDFASYNGLPWCILGDFNAYLYSHKKEGSSPVTSAALSGLQECMQDSHLIDCPFTGCFYTWSNKQDADSRIACKLDTVLINLSWLSRFPDSITEFLISGISNHSPMVISVHTGRGMGTKDYRYFNTWDEELDFLRVVEEAWHIPVQGIPMYMFITRLKNVKQHLINWRKSRFKNYSAQVEAAKDHLIYVQQ